MRSLCLLLSLLCLFCVALAEQCAPNYPRMFWNPNAQEINSRTIDLIFMFNTNVSCPYSYMQLYYDMTIYKFRCSQTKIQTYETDGSVEFFTYVQKCYAYVQLPKEVGTFQYRVFGSKFISGLQVDPSEEYLVEMPMDSLPFRLAVLSDWGPILVKPYKPLNDTLDFILDQRVKERAAGSGNEWRINGLMLNGDYAYNLETDKCQMYLLFMQEVSRVSSFWPILTTVGNHESTLPKSMYLFENSFVIGRLTTQDKNYERTQVYRFANRTTFLFFDPFLQIYKKGSPQQYETMKTAIKKELLHARANYPEEFLVMASHYPVMCSQDDPHCRDAMLNMPDLYEYLSTPQNGKGLVDLYIGSHMHQYERIWPLVNNKFVNESSPYYRGRLANFVEAVAGVNYFIIEVDYPTEYFSQFATHNVTGMGIMTFHSNSLQKQDFRINYKHIVTPNTYEVVDEWEVSSLYPPNNNLQADIVIQ